MPTLYKILNATSRTPDAPVIPPPSGFTQLQILMPGEVATPGVFPGKTGTPTAQTAGVAFDITVRAVNDLWFLINTVIDTVVLTTSDTHGVMPAAAPLEDGICVCSVTLKTSGNRTITATDLSDLGKLPVIGTSTIINPGSFTKLQVLATGEVPDPGSTIGKTGTPNSLTAGVALTLTVNGVDTYWNRVSSVSDTIHIASTDSNATIASNSFLVAGTKTFSVTPKTAGTATFTASDVTDSGKTSSTTPSISIAANTFVRLQIIVPGFTASPGSASGLIGSVLGQIAGTAFNITVKSTDLYWNPVTSTDVVGLTSTDVYATIPANAALVAGSKTFSVTNKTAGPWSFTASDITSSQKTPSTSDLIAVVAGAFTKLQLLVPGETSDPGSSTGKLVSGTPTPQTVDVPLDVIVNAVDANFNRVTTVTDVVGLTTTSAGSNLPTNTALVNGTKTLTLSLHTAGSKTITANDITDVAKASSISPNITVNGVSVGWVEISHVEFGASSGTSGAPINTTGADLIVIMTHISTNNGSIDANALTITGTINGVDDGNTYTPYTKYSSQNRAMRFFVAEVPFTGTNHVFTSHIALGYPYCLVSAWSGSIGPGAKDQLVGAATNSALSLPSPTLTPGVGNELVIAGAITIPQTVSGSPTIDSGFSPLQQIGANLSWASLVTSAATSPTWDWTPYGAGEAAISTISFKPASGGAAYTRLQILFPNEVALPGSVSGKDPAFPATAQVAGTPFTVRINATDNSWNVITAVADMIHITSSDLYAVLPPNAIISNGTGTFSVTLRTAGSKTVSANDLSFPSKTPASGPITVGAGAFSKLQLILPGETAVPGHGLGKTGGPTSHPSGTAFDVIANAVDSCFNLKTAITDVVHVACSDGTATTPANHALVAGTWTFTNGVTMNAANGTNETITITDVTDSGKTLDSTTLVCGTRSVINMSDFEYAGVLRVPVDVSNFSQGIMGAKKVGATVHFFMTGHLDTAEVIEWVGGTPAATQGAAPRPTYLNKYGSYGTGKFYDTKRALQYQDGTYDPNKISMGALHYVDDQHIWWTMTSTYNNGGGNETALGLTDISGGVNNCVTYGPWFMAADSHFASAWLVDIPVSFSAAHGNSWTMGAGIGLNSGNANSSWGPNLEIFSPPDPNVNPGGVPSTPVPCLTALRYSALNTSDVTSKTRISRRDGNYNYDPAQTMFAAEGPGPREGYWNQIDFDTGGGNTVNSAIWIDLPDKYGYLVAGFQGHGDIWYQTGGVNDNSGCCPALQPDGSYKSAHRGITGACAECGCVQGPVAQYYDPVWFIYDPADLDAILAGAPAYSKQWTFSFNPMLIQDISTSIGCINGCGGMWLDPVTRYLYVSSPSADTVDGGGALQTPLIHVYHIKP